MNPRTPTDSDVEPPRRWRSYAVRGIAIACILGAGWQLFSATGMLFRMWEIIFVSLAILVVDSWRRGMI